MILEGADSKKGGGRKRGGRWETEGWEVGEEKFVKWEKTDPTPKKNVNKFSLSGGRGKGQMMKMII